MAAAQPLLLEVSVNGQRAGEAVYALRDGRGHVYLKPSDLESWRLRPPARALLVYEGTQYLSLDSVEGLQYKLSDETQALAIDAAPNLFLLSNYVDEYDLEPMTPASSGAFLNYDLFAQKGTGSSAGAFAEAGVFSRHGYGTASLVGRWDGEKTELIRLDTSWTRDDPERLRSVRIGDAIARGSSATPPFRFGGIQWARNFAVRPGYLTMPVPAFQGSAALPSTADLYVNGMLAGQKAVPSGPFRIENAPLLSGSGEVRLVVRDPLGRETVSSFDYYSSTEMLRKGLHDFSYEAGFIRDHIGLKSFSYGSFMVSGTHRYGFSDWLTGEAHAEASAKRQLASASAALLAGTLGVVTVSAAASRGPSGAGALGAVGFERRSPGLSFAGRAEFATGDFGGVWQTSSYKLPQRTLTALVSLPLAHARVSASYIARDWKDRKERLTSVGATLPVGRIASLHVSGYYSPGSRGHRGVELFLSLPLGRNTNASAGYQRSRGGNTFVASAQRNLPPGPGHGYRVTASHGAIDRAEGEFFYQTDHQSYEIGASRLDGRTAVRAGVSGSIATVGGSLVAARRLDESFAVVKTGKFRGVRVYADNQLVGRTNGAGVAVIPRLRSFDRNMIRIEQGDFPVDVGVAAVERSVRPFARHGVHLVFEAKRQADALVTLVLADGTPVPAGAWARVGTGEPAVVAPGGVTYLTGLEARSEISVEWTGGSCRLTLDYPPGAQVQPDLGRQICRSSIYAVR